MSVVVEGGSVRVLGHRVLIKPDTPETETESGLVLPEDRDHVATSGTVVAIGEDGSEQGYRAYQQGVRDCLAVIQCQESEWNFPASLQVTREEVAKMLRRHPDYDIGVGDRALFPADAGQDVTIAGESYILMPIDDVLATVSASERAA